MERISSIVGRGLERLKQDDDNSFHPRTATALITAADIATAGTASVTGRKSRAGRRNVHAQTFTVSPAPAGAIRFVFANVSSTAVVGKT